MNIQKDSIIKELVAQGYQRAAVFKKYGIDFCCQGNRTIEDACTDKNIDTQAVILDLEAIDKSSGDLVAQYNTWSLDLLVDYIEKRHHRYVEEKSVEIKSYLDRICQVHGDRHPELWLIKEEFDAVAEELAMHMKKEEYVLFPYIRKMVQSKQENSQLEFPHFGTVQRPIHMMMQEHSMEGDRFRKLDSLSNHYTPPPDACNTYLVTYALLDEFEQDLHTHIHLENNILFPKSIALENQLTNA